MNCDHCGDLVYDILVDGLCLACHAEQEANFRQAMAEEEECEECHVCGELFTDCECDYFEYAG